MSDAASRETPALPILMYHNIARAPRDLRVYRSLFVSPAAFARQMWLLRRFGYTGLSMSAAMPYLQGERTGRIAIITLDAAPRATLPRRLGACPPGLSGSRRPGSSGAGALQPRQHGTVPARSVPAQRDPALAWSGRRSDRARLQRPHAQRQRCLPSVRSRRSHGGTAAAALPVAGRRPRRARAAADPTASRHHFLGWISNVHPYYSALSMLAFPSIATETFGRVSVEAQAAGVPVLGSDIGGIPETLEAGVTGLLLPPGDAAAWRDAILKLCDPALLASMGAAAHDYVQQHFSMQVIAAQFLQILAGH